MDSQGRRIIATEHAEQLRTGISDARTASGPRRRLGGLLISAGTRLAPDAAPPLRRPAER
jgi:hypothetical protein